MLHRLKEEAQIASNALQTIRQAAERVLTCALLASVFGGIVGAKLVGAFFWIL